MTNDKADSVVDSLDDARQRAIDGMVAANPDLDEPDDWREIYQLLSPLDEDQTHTVELELNDFEIVKLHDALLPMSRGAQMQADDMLVGASIIAQIIEQAPDHVERIDEFGDNLAGERGVY